MKLKEEARAHGAVEPVGKKILVTEDVNIYLILGC
jgi:hypothetical protein